MERKIELDTPCTLSEIAKFVGIGKSTIYQHVAEGYKIQYPRIGRTTPRHFLTWAETEEDGATARDSAADRRAAEMSRLLAGRPKS